MSRQSIGFPGWNETELASFKSELAHSDDAGKLTAAVRGPLQSKEKCDLMEDRDGIAFGRTYSNDTEMCASSEEQGANDPPATPEETFSTFTETSDARTLEDINFIDFYFQQNRRQRFTPAQNLTYDCSMVQSPAQGVARDGCVERSQEKIETRGNEIGVGVMAFDGGNANRQLFDMHDGSYVSRVYDSEAATISQVDSNHTEFRGTDESLDALTYDELPI